MNHLSRCLGGLLALCLGVRLAVWLLEPVLPLVVVLFTVVSLLGFILGFRRGL